jgi:2-methylcitrate dehydratase
VRLWHKIRTVEHPRWTARYHSPDPALKAFGGRVEIRMKNGDRVADELAVANAHPLGATPWQRADYIRKFETLTAGTLAAAEAKRFLEVVRQLPSLAPQQLRELTVALPAGTLEAAPATGIFGHPARG